MYEKGDYHAYNVMFQLSSFCDKDHEDTPASERHDGRAITEQNVFCRRLSAWEVMREHDDFKAGIYCKLTSVYSEN